jgi:hypothetical protein
MKLLKLTLFASLVLFGALLVAPNGIRLSADNDQTKDREAIEALMWKYARALDTLNADAYVACYTPDGQFIAGPTPTAGAAALHKMIADLKDRRDEQIRKGETPAPMFHMDMNKYVEFMGRDKARHHTYWQTVFGAVGRGGQVRVAAAGNAVDDLVKVNGNWLIKVRNVSPGTSD